MDFKLTTTSSRPVSGWSLTRPVRWGTAALLTGSLLLGVGAGIGLAAPAPTPDASIETHNGTQNDTGLLPSPASLASPSTQGPNNSQSESPAPLTTPADTSPAPTSDGLGQPNISGQQQLPPTKPETTPAPGNQGTDGKNGTNPVQSNDVPTFGPGAHMGQSIADLPASEVAGVPPAETKPLSMKSRIATPTNPPAGVLGMDVSGWQADPATYSVSQVNWNSQWNMGSRFVFTKATEGSSMVDASRASHLAGAKAVGMITGAYHFALPSQSSAISQANHFVNNGGSWKANSSTLPPLLDIENNPYASLGNSCYGMSPAAMVAWIKAFSSRVQSLTGRLPAIYTNYYWWLNCTGNSTAFTAQPLHIAAYGTSSPWMPGGWPKYSFWQYSDSGPFAGDSNTWNGTLAGLRAFAAQSGTVTAPVTPPSISSGADLVAADGNGALWNYPSNGKGGFGPRKQIGNSWTGMRSITVIDWNADGVLDIMAQRTNGMLSWYRGKATGGFHPPATLAASGWAGYQLSVGYWINSSGYPQILTRSSTGVLSLWRNNSGTTLSAPMIIGNGWGTMNLTMVDFDGDGNQDILAQSGNGNVRLFRSNGSGNFINEARATVATGWNTLTSVSVTSGFVSTGSVGLIQRTSAGTIRYLPVTGKSSFGPATSGGPGWSSFLIAGGENINLRQAPAAPAAPSLLAGDSSITASVVAGSTATSVRVVLTPSGKSCVIAGFSGKCVISQLTNGIPYTARATASNAAGTSALSAASSSGIPVSPVVRYTGVDRYATAAAISARSFPTGVPVAYVASGADFPDALSGAAAAGTLGGPVLLTATSGIPAVVKTELQRLKAKKIVILGGTGVVSPAVQSALTGYSSSVSRVAGIDRYASSAAVSATAFTPNVPVAYLASGTAFPDGLSAAAAGGKLGGPVLLTPPNGLTASVKTELARLKAKKIVILGGTAVVPQSVQLAAKSFSATVTRVAGVDRYHTSAEVSATTFAAGVPVVFIANGTTFPDALSGAAAAGHLNGPILLSTTNVLPSSVANELTRLKPRKIVVLGGNGAISSKVQEQLRKYVG